MVICAFIIRDIVELRGARYLMLALDLLLLDT